LLSRLLNPTWLILISRGPKMEITSTRIVQRRGHTHSANSCAVPCFPGKPRMYQQSSFPVITFTSLSHDPWMTSLLVMPQYGALINNLIVTTDRCILGSHTTPSSLSSSQGTKPPARICHAPLVWSIALRASRDITIQTSIEYVVHLSSRLSNLSVFFLRIGRSREYIDLTDE
jgi:hypothetical protein